MQYDETKNGVSGWLAKAKKAARTCIGFANCHSWSPRQRTTPSNKTAESVPSAHLQETKGK